MKIPETALKFGRALVLMAGLSALAGCATADMADNANDPFEGFNRGMFAFNQGVDKAVIKPAAEAYRWALPARVRDSLSNILDNLKTPVVLANDLLQGKFERAGDTIGRFIVNTTVGLGGVNDVASEIGIAEHREDFGQTLAHWGVGEGPYLMLPLLGPSNPRDLTGFIVDIFIDPFGYVASNNGVEYASGARTGTRALDTRSRNIETLEDLESTSLDFYAALRSLYRQRRDDEIRDGAPAPLPPVPIYGQDDGGTGQQATVRR